MRDFGNGSPGVRLGIIDPSKITNTSKSKPIKKISSSSPGLYKPIIILNPLSGSYNIGDTLILTITYLEGNPPETDITWYKNNILLTNGGRISGATTITLTIINYESGDADNYHAGVSNTIGMNISTDAIITTITSVDCITCGTGNTYFWDPTTPELDPIWNDNNFDPDSSILEFNNSRYELIGPDGDIPFFSLGGTLAAVPDRIVATLGISIGSIVWGGWTVRNGVVQFGMTSVFRIVIESAITFDAEPDTTTTRTLYLYGGGAGVTILDTITLDSSTAHVFSAAYTATNETTFYMDGDIIFVDTGSNPWTTGLYVYMSRNQNVGLTTVPWIQNIIAEKTGAGLPNACCPGPEDETYWTSTAGFTFP